MNNIKVVSIKTNKFDDILSSKSKIKDILKKKMENYENNRETNHDNNNNTKETKFKTQFFNPQKTKKRSIQDKLKRRKTHRNIQSEFFENVKPIIPNKNVLPIFQKVLISENMRHINKFIRLITRTQLILILTSLDMTKKNTRAPTPLLKNILYNFITSNIHIVVL
jgi:hypothetical protein